MKAWKLSTLASLFCAGISFSANANVGFVPTLQQLHEQTQKTTKLNYYGGPIISNVEVVAVFWGKIDPEVASKIGDYYTAMTNSTYMDFLGQYGTPTQKFGRGKYVGSVTIKPHGSTGYLDDTDIQKELRSQIDAGNLPKPSENTLYMNYFPRGWTISAFGLTSCHEFCAYHSSSGTPSTSHLFYGVMPDVNNCPTGCGYSSDMFNSQTAISSHEFMEAITDPFPTPGTNPAFPQAWNDDQGSEIGDLCVGGNNTLKTPNGNYVVQSEWDNSHKKCTNTTWISP